MLAKWPLDNSTQHNVAQPPYAGFWSVWWEVMINLVWTVLASILVVAAWLAHAHHRVYVRVVMPGLALTLMSTIVAMICFNVGVGRGKMALLPVLQTQKIDLSIAQTLFRSVDTAFVEPFWFRLLVGLILALVLLGYLPS